MKTKKQLTPRQEKFCQLYHESGNATQAYIGAGYSNNANSAETNAARMIGNDLVSVRLRDLQIAAAAVSGRKRQDVLDKLWAIADNETREARDVIAALKEVSRICGFYEPVKVEASIESKLIDMIADLTGAKQ
jgi:Terminase small subunit